MIQHPLKSSNLLSLGYNPETKTAVAKFNSMTFYRYDDVTIEAFVGVLTNEDSHGRAFNALIKKRYTGVKIDAEQAAQL